MKKKYIILLLVVLLLIAFIPFIPPVYHRFTKPMYKSYADAKEWYGKVDCEDLSEVKDYCERRGYNTDYYILVDFSIPHLHTPVKFIPDFITTKLRSL